MLTEKTKKLLFQLMDCGIYDHFDQYKNINGYYKIACSSRLVGNDIQKCCKKAKVVLLELWDSISSQPGNDEIRESYTNSIDYKNGKFHKQVGVKIRIDIWESLLKEKEEMDKKQKKEQEEETEKNFLNKRIRELENQLQESGIRPIESV
jgi:hypothetical protein